jgi:hypothetical protein
LASITILGARRSIRVLTAATLGVALLAAPAAPAVAQQTTDDPTLAAAGWLASQLLDGERIETEFDGDPFPDQGLTADVVLALAGAGVGNDDIEAATDWLVSEAATYTGTAADEVYAGATAKLAIVVDATGRDATDVEGTDLLAQLRGQEGADGRFTDSSEFGDFSSTISQSLAVIALARASDDGPSEAAVGYLLGQACDDGGFPITLDEEPCTADVDATGFAIQALADLEVSEDAAGDAVDAAVAWLLDQQDDDGAFAGDEGPNANTTGLAAVALDLAGEDDAADAARGWLSSLQQGCDDDEPGAIAFAPDTFGDGARATAQALPALTGASLATVTSDGAAPDAPLLACDGDTEDAGDGSDTEEADDAATDDDAAEEEQEPTEEDGTEDEADEVAIEDTGAEDEGGTPAWLWVLLAVVVVGAVAYLLSRRGRGGDATA